MVDHSGIGGSSEPVQSSDNLAMDPGLSSSPFILGLPSYEDPLAPDSATTANLDPGPQSLVDLLLSEPTGLRHSAHDRRMTLRMHDSIAQQPPQKHHCVSVTT